MAQTCPRCGAPSEGLCGRCAAYLLRFDPFLIRPRLPGPPVDTETRRGVAVLTLDPKKPVVVAPPPPRPFTEAYAVQFLAHVGLPDAGDAVLTRGDGEVLRKILRTWARSPPKMRDLREKLQGLYREAAALPGLPSETADQFRSLARTEDLLVAELPPPLPMPPEPEPEPEPEPAPGPQPSPDPEDRAPALPVPPPPPDEEIAKTPPAPAAPKVSAKAAVEGDALEGDATLEAEWRTGLMDARVEEIQRREAALSERERAIAEEARRLERRRAELEQRTTLVVEPDERESTRFLLSSIPGVSPESARALSQAFATEERLVAATAVELAKVSGVSPEQAALVREALTSGAIRRQLSDTAREMLEEGRNQEALQVFDALVRLNPSDTDAWMNRGEVLALLGHTAEAIEAYGRVALLEPEHRGARRELANLLFEKGDYGLAVATLQEYLRSSPDDVPQWLSRAAALLADGKATEATLVYNAILEGDPKNLPASLALGDLLLAMGDIASADREYARALQHHPDAPEALLKKGLLLNRQGRWGAAIQLFNRAITIRGNYTEAWNAKGQVFLSQGKPKDALECFDKLLAIDDKVDDAWLGKAQAHHALGETESAAEAAQRALALNEGNKEVRLFLERIGAAVSPAKVFEVPPTMSVSDALEPDLLVKMADMLLESGDAPSAIRVYDGVLAKEPRNARAWFGKGRTLHDLSRYAEALKCFTSALSFDPANPDYLNWLEMCGERLRKESSA